MLKEYYKIKDQCREKLSQHLAQVISCIPNTNPCEILDIGCGTGVPTFFLAQHYSGTITAIDINKNALDLLQDKITEGNHPGRVTIQNVSFLDFQAEPGTFDIILAEGFLNVVGFETGFPKIVELLKPGGYIIIHDEFKDHEKKMEYIASHNCHLLNTLYLDEAIWWNDYYDLLNKRIKEVNHAELIRYFNSDIQEIDCYRISPEQFRSIYYLISKDKNKP